MPFFTEHSTDPLTLDDTPNAAANGFAAPDSNNQSTGLQDASEDGVQAQTGVENRGLQDAFPDDTGIPRTRMSHRWNKPDTEPPSDYNPYGNAGLTAKQLANIRRSFEDDPLACVDNPEDRARIETIIGRFGLDDQEQLRKSIALAHYYAMNHREKTGFIFDNLPAAIEEFEGKPMSVDQAYESVRNLFNPQQDGVWGNRLVAAATAGGAKVAKTAVNAASLLSRVMLEYGMGYGSSVMRLIDPEGQAEFELHRDEIARMPEEYLQRRLGRPIQMVESWAQQNKNVPGDWVTNSESLGDWMTNAGLTLVNYAPQLAAQIGLSVATGGTTALGVVFGIDGYYDIKGDMPELGEWGAVLYGVGVGAVNSVLEKVSLGIVEGKVSEEFVRRGLKKGLGNILLYLGVTGVLEGAEEGVEEMAENLLDIAMGRRGDTKEWTGEQWAENIFQGVPEAVVLGGATGGIMGAPHIGDLRATAERNEVVRTYIGKRKAELDAKDELTSDEELERSTLSAAADSNDPAQVLQAVQTSILNQRLRRQRERTEAQARYNEAQKKLSDATEALNAISDRSGQNAANRNTAVLKQRAAQAEFDRAKAELEAARQDFVKAFPEEETDEERQKRQAEETRLARDTKRRIGWNPQDTVDAVNEAAKQYPGISIRAVWTYDALPQAAKEYAERQGINPDSANAVWYNGDVYVIADKVRPGNVLKKVQHEVIGHEGLRRVFGKDFDGFLDGVFSSHRQEIEDMGLSALYNTTADTQDGQRLLAEEYLARIAESYEKPSWWKEMLAQIRAYLRKMFPGIRYSDADIEAALIRSARATRQNSRGGTNGNRFALGGEIGASRLADTKEAKRVLAIEMEDAGKDVKTIWLATGWERGKDRQWRFELPDMKVKLNILNTEELNEKQGWYLWDFANGNELFKAYPELKDIIVRMEELPSMVYGHYDPMSGEIVLNKNGLLGSALQILGYREEDAAAAKSNADKANANEQLSAIRNDIARIIDDTLVHEVQHAIQEVEGFAKGTNPKEAENIDHASDDPVHGYKEQYEEKFNEAFRKLGDLAKEKMNLEEEDAKSFVNSVFDLIVDEGKDENRFADDIQELIELYVPDADSALKQRIHDIADRLLAVNNYVDKFQASMSAVQTYKRFAGEVEGRNIQKRAEMGEDVRRKLPPSSTEDVHRDFQIVRFSVAGADEDLIAVHNVSEQKLRDAIKLGALPVPSIGIISAQKSDFTDYGGITLVADKSLIDPKRPKNKVFDSDIYSARKPEIQRMYSDDDYDRALELIAPYEKDAPFRESIQRLVQYHKDDMMSSDFEDDLKQLDAVKNWYADTKEDDEGFEDWWQRVAAPELQLSQEGRIFDGFTNSGRRRYLPANLETIVKLMTRKVKDSEGFFYGVGNIRANLAKKFRSIEDIQKNRNRIIPGEEYKALKKEASDEYYALLDDIEHAITGGRVGRSREAAEDLLRAMAEGVNKRGNREWLVMALGTENPIYQQMADFLVKLKNLPTPLFEAKPQRAVYLDEFKAAVVPDNTARDILHALEEAGVEIYTYEHGNEAARKATLQLATQEKQLRFALENMSEEDKAELVTILKPKWTEEAFVEPSEVKAYLESIGETGIDDNTAWALYQLAGKTIRQEKQAAAQKERDKWIWENNPLYRHVAEVTGENIVIRPAERFEGEEFTGTFISPEFRKYSEKRPQKPKQSDANYQAYLRNREEKLRHATGMHSDEIAEAIARKYGGDAIDIEQEIIDYFRNLTKPQLYKGYSDYNREQNYRNRQDQEAAEQEYAEYRREQIQETVNGILENGQTISEEWAIANPEAFQELYRILMQQEPPKTRKPSKENLEAMNAALSSTDVNAATYKAARRAAWNSYQKKLTALRQEMNDRNANAAKLQREAAAFAEENLPEEQRGEFIRGIIRLLDFGTSPSKKYPEGQRMAEFYKLQDKMLEAQQKKRTQDSIGHIREMLDAVKMKRNWKGIPTSVIPSEQGRVDRIRKIVDLNAASIANAIDANNSRILDLEKLRDSDMVKLAEGEIEAATDIEAERQRLVEDNALLELFGNLQYRKPDSVTKAEAFLEELIKGGKAKFKALLAEQAGRVIEMRQQAVEEITGGKNILPKQNTDAGNHTNYISKNMSMISLLHLVASRSGLNYDDTLSGKLQREVEDSTQAEATANRTLQEDFDKKLDEILGTGKEGKFARILAKGRFLKQTGEVVEHSGVFKTEYSMQKYIDAFGKPIIQEGRSASRVHLIPVEDYPSFDRKQTLPGVRSILRAIDSGGSYEIEDGVPLDETAVWFLRKQLDDYDTGIDRRMEFFKDEIDEESAKRMEEDSAKDKLAVISRGKNVEEKRVEVPLSQGQALQILLTWEQPEYQPNMKWNGWTEESIEQIKKFLTPETKQLGEWMRDYFAAQRDALDEAVVKRYGAHLPVTENYWPGRFVGARSTIGTSGMRGAGTMSINPNFLIARKFHLNPIDTTVDAFSVFSDGQVQQNHFLAWSDTIRDLREVFGDASVQNAINGYFGKEVTRNLTERIISQAQGGAKSDGVSQIMSRLYRHWIPAKIALNIGSITKQMLSSVAYMNNMPVDDFVKYMSRANSGNAEYRAFLRMAIDSDYLKNRMAGGLDKDLIYMMQNTRDSAPYSALGDSLMTISTYGTKLADKWSTLHGGFAVYQYTLDQALKSGLSRSEALDRAKRAWMRSTDETQQSGYLKDLNYFQQNQGAVRFLTAFLSNPIQVMNLELQTLNEIRYSPDNNAAKAKLARQILVNHLLVPTLMKFTTDFIRSGFSPQDWWDEAEMEDYFTAWLFGPFEGLFLVSKLGPAVVNEAFDWMLGRKQQYLDTTIDAIPLAGEAIRNARNFKRDVLDGELTEDDFADAMAFLGDVGMAFGATPLPGSAEAGAAGTAANAIGTQWKRFLRIFRGDTDKKQSKQNSGGSKNYR